MKCLLKVSVKKSLIENKILKLSLKRKHKNNNKVNSF